MSYKGIIWSKETIEKRAEALRGGKRTPEQRKRMSDAAKGKVLSKESIAKRTETRRKNGWNKNPEETHIRMIENHVGRTGQKWTKGEFIKHSLAMIGDKNPMWKGDDVGYSALHDWIERTAGKPKKCCHCKKKKKRYTWANISHEYKRDVKDWIRLCYSCHKLYDLGKIKLCLE